LKRFLFIIIGLWSFLFLGLSQNVSVSGIQNHYLKVKQVLTNQVSVTETVSNELSYFRAGDKVLIIQMTGVTIDSTIENFKTTESKTKEAINNTGKFEILQVDEVYISATDTLVIFTDNLSNNYDASEKIQLVKFVEGETVSLIGPVTALDWDGEVGGIVAIIGTDSIKLNSNIEVSAKGFHGGAVPTETYTLGCRNDISSSVKDTLYFLPSEMNRSGNKGEGIITASWPYTKGTAFNINGGGAGNGLYSGGGGGSNFRVGGIGGRQSATCMNPLSVRGGWGGYACQELYRNDTLRVIMGGGGGSGTKQGPSALSKGGDGGGLVILITGTLASSSSSNTISANGENAISTAGSGGGGGGGGAILIDATNYAGTTFSIKIRGGNGGNTTPTVECTGAGGSGSGGVLWYAGTSFPAVSVDSASTPGTTAGGTGCPEQNGIVGQPGTKLKGLIMPLTGFLFNTIRGDDIICAGQVPGMLTASQPKGGTGTYGITWQQSTDSMTWSPTIGDTRTFQPPVLNQTTWYRRVVTSDTITDISRAIKVFVYPAVGNNSITGSATICYNNNAKPLNGIATPLTGGNGLYSYKWQESNNQTAWDSIGHDAAFDPDALTSSTYYRRVVSSTAYCHDTSNTVMITVLPSITMNGFDTGDTSICINQSPGQLDAQNPEGGDDNYSYSWQNKTLSGNWTTIPTSNFVRYIAPVISGMTSYRRIVFSGIDSACIDTGNVKTINTMPLITNNSILGDPVQYTCFNTPILLEGSEPENGFGALTYAYRWEQSNNNTIWTTVADAGRDYQSTNLTNTRYFRRTVFSTPENHECTDISDTLEVRINPLPTGNIINTLDTLCAGEILYVKFNAYGNGPFDVTLRGEGLGESTKTSIYSAPDSISFRPVSTVPFIMVSIQDDSSCYADISMFTADTPAVVYKVPVANAGIEDAICSDTYTLQAVKSITGSTGLWTAAGVTFIDHENPNSNVTVDNYGHAVFTWTETNWQCIDADEVEITFHEQPQAPDAGSDQVLDFNYKTQLQAVPASVGKGQWTVITGTGEFDNDTLPDAEVSELASTTSLKWMVTNGNCPAVADSMQILINPLIITKGFTPNNDSKNDYFDIGAVNAELISIKIFNSTGMLVYESDNYLEGDLWDGTNINGVELPEGTYFYLINIKVAGKQEEVQFRSFVEILR
jgi:gliding motility-associated-like protein